MSQERAGRPHQLATLSIHSPQNPRIKRVLKLRDRRGRDKLQRIVIDGWREVDYARQAGVRIEEAFFPADQPLDPARLQLLRQLRSGRCELIEVAPAVHAKIAFGHRLELVGVATVPATGLEQLDLPAAPLIAVLDSVEKPGNFGAVVRSADAAGIHAVVAAEAGTDLFNPNAIRASLATVFSVPVAAGSREDVLQWLRQRVERIFVARVDGAIDYREADLRGAIAIVLGSEARGVSVAWDRLSPLGVRLPMLGTADSLNVSATAAVLFYEALRQRSA